jgi:hypothetical protein
LEKRERMEGGRGWEEIELDWKSKHWIGDKEEDGRGNLRMGEGGIVWERKMEEGSEESEDH